MSGNAGSIGAIALGVVIGVISIAFPPAGAGFLYYAGAMLAAGSMVAGGALGLAFQPQSTSPGAAKAKDLDFASSGEGFPVPVIFGEVKVVGNFMNWRTSGFRSKKIKATGGKGGDGGGTVIGYDYYLTFEYGLCMGPIDEIGQVYSIPGEIPVRGVDPAQLVFSGDTPIELTLTSKNEGGLVRVYRGSSTQTREADLYSDSGMNYRNICWGMFLDFKINKNVPQVKSYQFVLRRLSRCIRDDATTVTAIKTRGSANSSHPAYYQANPAAILYECLTNRLWGRGLSSDIIDEDSFAVASEYFEAKGIGMSFKLEQADKLISIIDSIRMHLKTILVWDADVLKLRVLMDPDTTHANILTLTRDEISEFSVMRPLWPSTFNEIRVEFNNKERNYKPDSIMVESLANHIVTGRLNPMQLQLNGFTDWNIARRQAYRLLRENSYPFMTTSFKMNRFKSQLEIGDVFRIVWTEYGAGTVTAYFMCMALEAADNDDDSIQVTAIEDIFLSPLLGSELSVAIPSAAAWDKLADIATADVNLFETPVSENGEITPITAIEMPALFTGGAVARVLILGQLPTQDVLQMQVSWVKNGKTNWKVLGNADTFAITGEALTTIRHARKTDRSSSFLEFSLTNPTLNEADLLADASLVSAPADDLETLDDSEESYLIIGQEIIQVGKIEKVSSNHYRARNVIRGCFGSPINFHEVSDGIFFVFTLGDGFDTKAITKKNKGNTVKFRAWPETTAGVTQVGADVFIFHRGENNQKYLAEGIRPLPPAFLEIDVVGFLATITLRPRFYNRGAGIGPLIGEFDPVANLVSGEIVNPVEGLEGMTFKVVGYDAGGDIRYESAPDPADVTFTPGSVSQAGFVTIENVPTQIVQTFRGATTAIFTIRKFKVYSVVSKQSSVDAAWINI